MDFKKEERKIFLSQKWESLTISLMYICHKLDFYPSEVKTNRKKFGLCRTLLTHRNWSRHNICQIFYTSIIVKHKKFTLKRGLSRNILNLKYDDYLVLSNILRLSIEYRVNIKWPSSTKTDWACVGVYINLRFLLCQSVLGQSKM